MKWLDETDDRGTARSEKLEGWAMGATVLSAILAWALTPDAWWWVVIPAAICAALVIYNERA